MRLHTVILTVYRIVVTAFALAIATQPLWIGLFLQGSFDHLAFHRGVGGALIGGGWLILAVSALLWWPGRGSWVPMVISGLVVVGLIAQFTVGAGRRLAVHIPLGVLLVAGAVALAVWAWSPKRTREVWGARAHAGSETEPLSEVEPG